MASGSSLPNRIKAGILTGAGAVGIKAGPKTGAGALRQTQVLENRGRGTDTVVGAGKKEYLITLQHLLYEVLKLSSL